MGVLSLVTTLLQPSSFVTFSYGEVSYTLVAFALLGALSVFGLVWAARSAHELTGPRPWPAEPAARQSAAQMVAAARAGDRPPADPRGGQPRERHAVLDRPPGPDPEPTSSTSPTNTTALFWLALDLLVGVGAPALLILAAVLRRTQRLIRATILTLVLLAAIGAAPHRVPPRPGTSPSTACRCTRATCSSQTRRARPPSASHRCGTAPPCSPPPSSCSSCTPPHPPSGCATTYS